MNELHKLDHWPKLSGRSRQSLSVKQATTNMKPLDFSIVYYFCSHGYEAVFTRIKGPCAA